MGAGTPLALAPALSDGRLMMAILTETQNPPSTELAPETREFYRGAMSALDEGGAPFLVGGAYAYARYTGIVRHTKDFDVFVRPERLRPRARRFSAARDGRPSAPSPTGWARRRQGDDFVDVIFSSGNGVARVDDLWFEHAVEEEVLGMPCQAGAGRGDDLVQVLHHGARALRRRRRGPRPPRPRRRARLGPPAPPLRATTAAGGCCSPT